MLRCYFNKLLSIGLNLEFENIINLILRPQSAAKIIFFIIFLQTLTLSPLFLTGTNMLYILFCTPEQFDLQVIEQSRHGSRGTAVHFHNATTPLEDLGPSENVLVAGGRTFPQCSACTT